MATKTLDEIAALRARLVDLEKAATEELAGLPAKYGFTDAAAFAAAVRAASQGAVRPSRGRKRRGKVTPATRAEVKRLAKAGKTAAEIALAVRISVGSVHLIKKALGLVRKRRK